MARPGLDKHPKYRMLVRMMGEPRPYIRGYLEMLWEVAYEHGDPVIGNEAAVEAAAEYPGERGKLFSALLNCGGEGAGFIEQVAGRAGVYQVHDLLDHAPEYVKKRFQRERHRKSLLPKKKRRRTMADNGGQCPTMAENGKPPAPAPAPAPAPLNTGTGAFAGLVTDDLRDNEKLANWIDKAAKRKRPVVTTNTQDRVRVFAAAERALEAGDDPPKLFAFIVGKAQWHLINQTQEDRAAQRLKALDRGPPGDELPEAKQLAAALSNQDDDE